MIATDVAIITDEELRAARITREAFLERVQKHYCPALTRSGHCTRVCTNCKGPLQGALMNIMPRVRSPEAVVTWRLRGAAAIVAERKSVISKAKQVLVDKNGFKLPKSKGFDGLAKKLGVK